MKLSATVKEAVADGVAATDPLTFFGGCVVLAMAVSPRL
jgi:hypothetical protein